MGDSPQIIDNSRDRSVARIRGLEKLLCLGPGACAPGFMLTPASQAKRVILFVQSPVTLRISQLSVRLISGVSLRT